jgi:hypothetical protein
MFLNSGMMLSGYVYFVSGTGKQCHSMTMAIFQLHCRKYIASDSIPGDEANSSVNQPIMSQDSPNSQSQLTLSSLDDEQRQLLENRYPRAGYWFNMLPIHPFIHGSGSQATASGEAQSHAPVLQRLHDLAEIALSTASDLSISTQQPLAAVNSTLGTSKHFISCLVYKY